MWHPCMQDTWQNVWAYARERGRMLVLGHRIAIFLYPPFPIFNPFSLTHDPILSRFHAYVQNLGSVFSIAILSILLKYD